MKIFIPISFILLIPIFNWAQTDDSGQLKSIDEVIQGIDSLLDDLDSSSGNQPNLIPVNPELFPSNPSTAPDKIDRSFRLGNELMPGNLLNAEPQSEIPATNEPVNEDDLGEIQSSPLSPNINFLPEGNADSGKKSPLMRCHRCLI